jgi:hypothetical protein
MRNNRSVPPCPVIPVLRYPDPAVAAQWLGKAFGFTVRLRIANHRIQMRAGEGCFTIAEGDIPPNHSPPPSISEPIHCSETGMPQQRVPQVQGGHTLARIW